MSNKLKLDKRVIKETASNILNLDNIVEIYDADTIDKKVENATDSKLTVLDGLVAEGIDETTTSIMKYGVNVFSTVTLTDYCTKLPQPITGKSTKVVNMSAMALTLYPSNVGGRINNLPIDTPVSIPPDGIAYEFICIENPLPGAWVWTPPATNQFDSGEMTGTTTLGVNAILQGTEVGVAVAEYAGFYASTSWVFDNKNKPSNILDAFRPLATNFNAITKIKVYTNLVPAGPGSSPTFSLLTAIGSHYYDVVLGTSVTNGVVSAGHYGGYGSCNQTVGTGGTLGAVSPNIGDPGTCYGELAIPNGGLTLGTGISHSFIGRQNKGIVPNPYLPSHPTHLTFEEWFAGMISFQIQPRDNFVDFKFRFILEYN
jgi:hypothetical protein